MLGIKKDQSQKFLEDGSRIPVTSVAVGENKVIAVKTPPKHGYCSIQLTSTSAPLFLREVRLSDADSSSLLQLGDIITALSVFKAGDIIDVIGISKGKGYAGVVKRHHFKGGPRTHGQSDRERSPGSIGQSTTPGRVYKGKRMAGRMGKNRVTIKNLRVVDVTDSEILIKGLIPGIKNSLIMIRKVGEDKKFIPLFRVENKKLATRLSMPGTGGQATETLKEGEDKDGK